MADNYAFASDTTAGICPEALAAIAPANAGWAPSYGDDAHTAEARQRIAQVFETECEVFFVGNGTAANALVLAALCQRHHGILCHAMSHVDTDECGAPEFFTGGSKVVTLPGAHGKLQPDVIEPALRRGHGVHFSKHRVLSLTQSTEVGTVYTPAEIKALASFAHEHGLLVHLDGARFANAAATLAPQGYAPADFTWRAGIDVLCFGGTKNGLLGSEAVVFFRRELAREFEFRLKQSGQLPPKQRFSSAQWNAVLRDGAWLRHAAHANRCARQLADGLQALGFTLQEPPEANGVFVEMPPKVFAGLTARGWHFYPFIGERGYRLMCSWSTREEDVAALLADVATLAK
jgi:threonine aldolase